MNSSCPGINEFLVVSDPLRLLEIFLPNPKYLLTTTDAVHPYPVRERGSLLSTEEIALDAACAVIFLASYLARWITGTAVPVDSRATVAVGIAMPNSTSIYLDIS